MAVLLALVGGLALVILLERHSVIHLAYKRQVDAYRDRHEGAGVMECVLNWMGTARGRDLLDAVDQTGKAFAMELPEGRRLTVYIEDGQGELLRDTSTITGRRREIAQDAVFIVETMPEDLKVDGLFRTVGPPELSVNAAKPLAIRALCLAILADPVKAQQAADVIVRRRGDTRLKSNELTSALSDLNLTPEQNQELASMLVVTPTLYRVVAEATDSSGNVVARSIGLYPVEQDRQETFKQSGGFLSWESVPLDPRR
jgi:hypothetical protein